MAGAQAHDKRRTEAQVHLTVPDLAPGLNQLREMHYHDYRKARNRWQQLVRSLAIPREVYPARVWIDRYYARNPMDIDNLYGGAKLPLDVLCRVGWLRDDDPDALKGLTCKQHKVDTEDEQRTEIYIWS